jgi:hypothetical protein
MSPGSRQPRCRWDSILKSHVPDPDPTAPSDKPHHQLTETALKGQLGGPTYVYRSAVIDCMKGAHVCRLTLYGHCSPTNYIVSIYPQYLLTV